MDACRNIAAKLMLAWLPLGWNRWLFVWIALAVGTVGLVVLLRTRLRAVSTWRKCALLSLWVHVTLFLLATSVHLFSGAPGKGPEEPIRVAMLPVEEPAESTPAKKEAPPDWERAHDPPPLEPPPLMLPEADELPAAEAPATTARDEPKEPYAETPAASVAAESASEPLSAPPLLPVPEPSPAAPAAKRTKANVAAAKPQVDKNAPTTAAPPAATPAEPTPAPSNELTPAKPPRPAPPATYAARFSRNRGEIVARRGGNERTELAVKSALAWLAGAQSADGRWQAARFGAGAEKRTLLGHDRAGAGSRADSAVTGLALLAFLGSGHTHQEGGYQDTVEKGLEYLRTVQLADGSLAGEATAFDRTYCHSMAALALCEAYAVTHDERLVRAAGAAAAFTVNTQNSSDGGWRYTVGMPGDTSQLGWQLMVLKSADAAGLDVPAVVWTRADRFVRSVTRGASGGLACYRPDSRPTTSMTAEALFCRQLLADRLGGAVDDGCYGEAASTLLRDLPGSGEANLYYWYYATLALCNEQDRSPVAKGAWQRWNDALVRTVLADQRNDGSWPTTSLWGDCGGQVYTTAIAALSLEAYYRYLPVDPAAELARGQQWRSQPVHAR